MQTLDIIVLGLKLPNHNRIIHDPQLIPDIYKSRLDKAVDIYTQNPGSRIIISGSDVTGIGVSEARVGFEYLLSQYCRNIPGIWNDVLLEEQARGTLGNAVYTKLMLLANGSRTPHIISSDYHMERVNYVFGHVYGPEFQPTFISTSSGLDKKALDREVSEERQRLRRATEFFQTKSIGLGDHKKVLDILEEIRKNY